MPTQLTRRIIVFVTAILLTVSSIQAQESDLSFDKTDWPWWRGPERNGVADADQTPPMEWSEEKNVLWKTPVPGKGHGSPIVVGDRVILPTADEKDETRSLICLNKTSGEEMWTTIIHKGNPTLPRNKKGTQASSTAACDGQRVFINFLHDGKMFTSAVSLTGEMLWQSAVCEYQVHQGYGSSPAIYKNLVIVSADSKAGGAIAALDRRTGATVWKHSRPELPNYPSPIILSVAGKTQVLMTGCDLVSSFDPETGGINWEMEGATTECVTSTVTNGNLIYSSGGYPKNHMACYRGDGAKELVWENNTRIYVPSMLIKGQHLYAVGDAGIAFCFNAKTGEELWKGRLRGDFTSSPVLVGDHIYVTNELGRTFVYEANPAEFQLISENQLGTDCFATPVIAGSRIYQRVGVTGEEGERQEYLYCLGGK